MNKSLAISILEPELDKFFDKSWDELKTQIGEEPHADEINGSDGVEYQIEIQCFWDDKKGGSIRIMGSVDDGGFRAYFPITRDRIKQAEQGCGGNVKYGASF